MNAAELRIGNWISSYIFLDARPVHFGPKEIRKVKVTAEDIKFISDNFLATYEGIGLSAEILEKCGILPNENKSWYNLSLPELCGGQELTLTMSRSHKGYVIGINIIAQQGMDCFDIAEACEGLKREDYPNGIGFNVKEASIWFKEIHYLHQLQNLYFTLTGKELDINL